jgi:hypothetical protein
MTMNKIQQLEHHTGTTAYHKFAIGNLKGTDGFIDFLQSCSCFWIGDIIASVQNDIAVKDHKGFIVWKVTKQDDGAVVNGHTDCESDGSYSENTLVYEQEIEYTDFPFKDTANDTFEFYQVGDVLLLKGEY